MSRWVVLKRRVGAVTSQRVLKVLFYVNILQCFFVVENFTENFTANAVQLKQNIHRRKQIKTFVESLYIFLSTFPVMSIITALTNDMKLIPYLFLF
jgi:hypothetical protein